MFHKFGATVNINNELKATGRVEHGLFVLNVARESQVNTISGTCSEDSLMNWHRRLGHVNTAAIMKMANEEMVNGLKISGRTTVNCEVCARSKITEHPYPKKAEHRADKPLVRVHSDLCQVPKASYGGARYFVTFIDDYSRFVKVYCLKSKDETFEAWIDYKNQVENQIGQKIQVLRSDNGREYVNDRFKKQLRECGIIHETSVPHSPSQNGVAERQNRVLLEMARCMILDAQMPDAAWAEAITTAAYIRNRLYSSATNRTPFELFYGRKPQVSHIRRFGVTTVALKEGQNINKLHPKGEVLKLVGYSPTQKGYRLISPQNGKLIISRDVRFMDEDNASYPYVLEEDSEDNSREDEEELYDGGDDVKKEEEAPMATPRRNPDREKRYKPELKPEVKVSAKKSPKEVRDPRSYEEAVDSELANDW
jgi:transposase InsO family protein